MIDNTYNNKTEKDNVANALYGEQLQAQRHRGPRIRGAGVGLPNYNIISICYIVLYYIMLYECYVYIYIYIYINCS